MDLVANQAGRCRLGLTGMNARANPWTLAFAPGVPHEVALHRQRRGDAPFGVANLTRNEFPSALSSLESCPLALRWVIP